MQSLLLLIWHPWPLQRADSKGRQHELEGQLRNVRKELDSDLFRQAGEKHRNKMIEMRVGWPRFCSHVTFHHATSLKSPWRHLIFFFFLFEYIFYCTGRNVCQCKCQLQRCDSSIAKAWHHAILRKCYLTFQMSKVLSWGCFKLGLFTGTHSDSCKGFWENIDL